MVWIFSVFLSLQSIVMKTVYCKITTLCISSMCESRKVFIPIEVNLGRGWGCVNGHVYNRQPLMQPHPYFSTNPNVTALHIG